MQCTFSGTRGETIVAYLYDDITPLERAAFESHLDTCPPCRDELAELRGVRAEMRGWSPPTFSRQSSLVGQQPLDDSRQAAVVSHQPRGFWREMPAWAQAAAALLVVGVSAGAANINVHHDATGFTVRTGWMPAPPAPAPVTAQVDQAPWRADVAKLESDIASARASNARIAEAVAATPARSSARDEEVLQKVKALLTDSEKKQENELALRIAQVVRDRQNERVSDMISIERRLTPLQASTTNTGFEVQRLRDTQNQLLRVSQTVR
jgi:hypothetical protein